MTLGRCNFVLVIPLGMLLRTMCQVESLHAKIVIKYISSHFVLCFIQLGRYRQSGGSEQTYRIRYVDCTRQISCGVQRETETIMMCTIKVMLQYREESDVMAHVILSSSMDLCKSTEQCAWWNHLTHKQSQNIVRLRYIVSLSRQTVSSDGRQTVMRQCRSHRVSD